MVRRLLALSVAVAAACSDGSASDNRDGSAGRAGALGASGGASSGGAAGSSATGGVGAEHDGGGGTSGADAAAGRGGMSAGSGGTSGIGGTAGGPEAEAALGSFELTYYWVTSETDFSGTPDTAIYDDACNVIATVVKAFADALTLEGTGRLADGRLLNYSGACGCPYSPCFIVADSAHPWGYGVQGRALVPFRSIAVDPNVIAYGTKLYVVEFDGVTMPGDAPWGGFVHDGCVSADDTGSAIVGKHIDFFAALEQDYRTLDQTLGLSSVTVFEGGARCP